MFSASSSDREDGIPLVNARFWSKSLKPLVSVRKVQMVMEGMIMGSLTRVSTCQPLAPSISAASISSPGMEVRPEM